MIDIIHTKNSCGTPELVSSTQWEFTIARLIPATQKPRQRALSLPRSLDTGPMLNALW
jgi:hypothetical protein